MPDASPALRIAVPLQSPGDRRGNDRYAAEMPLTVDGRETTTQDLSPTGLSFVSQQPYAVGARVRVVIDYLLDGANYPLECEVEVVRVQAAPDGYRIGTRLLAPLDRPDIAVPDTEQAAGLPSGRAAG